MKRRELFIAAAAEGRLAATLLALDNVDLPDAGALWPSAQKLGKQKREVQEQMSKVRLANGDAPDALPRPPLPRRRK